MNKACVIAAYFGKLPDLFPAWITSIEYNKDIDFLLVTDCTFTEYKIPVNLNVVSMTLDGMRNLIKDKLGLDNPALSEPYKCCDYKPVYGIIFQDYVKEYEFVGHCDLDIIFGRINGFISEEIWDNFDKILPLGHLSFYRNTKEVLDYYKLEGKVYADYKKAFSSDEICVFDEEAGINSIYRENNLRLYDKYIMADISERNKRLKLTQMSIRKNDKYQNYNYQVFSFEKGGIYRNFIDAQGRIGKDEFVYLHAKKRQIICDILNSYGNEAIDSFIILSDRIIRKDFEAFTKDRIMEYSEFISEKHDIKERDRYNRKDLLKRGKKKWKRIKKRLLR